MKKRPYLYLIIGIFILIVPTVIYLFFLVPQLTEEYNTLMASGGIIGSAGIYGVSKIPEEMKFSKLFKLAANAFTYLSIILIVEKFIIQLVGLIAVFVVSYIIYKIFKEIYINARTRKANTELAEQITRSIGKNS